MYYYDREDNTFYMQQRADGARQEWSDEEWAALFAVDKFHYVDYDEAQDKPVQKLLPQEELDGAMRKQRKILFDAFDIYKQNLFYGIEEETEAEHAAVLEWYAAAKDLSLAAFTEENIPRKIKKYR